MDYEVAETPKSRGFLAGVTQPAVDGRSARKKRAPAGGVLKPTERFPIKRLRGGGLVESSSSSRKVANSKKATTTKATATVSPAVERAASESKASLPDKKTAAPPPPPEYSATQPLVLSSFPVKVLPEDKTPLTSPRCSPRRVSVSPPPLARRQSPGSPGECPGAPLRPIRRGSVSLGRALELNDARAVASSVAFEDVDSPVWVRNPATRELTRELPLLVAARRCSAAVIGALLQAGAEPNAVDSKGRTALQLVARRRERTLRHPRAEVPLPERLRFQTDLRAAYALLAVAVDKNGAAPKASEEVDPEPLFVPFQDDEEVC